MNWTTIGCDPLSLSDQIVLNVHNSVVCSRTKHSVYISIQSLISQSLLTIAPSLFPTLLAFFVIRRSFFSSALIFCLYFISVP